jgi:DNA adenine methylase
MNFWAVLRENKDELVSKVAFTPYSRALYENLREKWRSGQRPPSKLERAWEWYVLMRQSFSGILFTGWSHGKDKSWVSPAKKWVNAANRLIEVADRLSTVQLECLDFREVVETYDSPETLFYVDPPYVNCPAAYYDGHVLDEQAHRDLSVLLNNLKGKVIVSYYPNPLLDELYPKHKWRREQKQVVVHSMGITRNHSVVHRPQATELLLMNYEPPVVQLAAFQDDESVSQ